MCIIVVKKIGLDLPSKQILKTCFQHNSDGAGFMFTQGGKINIEKGFMTFDEYYKAILQIPNPQDKNIVFHLRIGTHSSNSPQNTHPFVISDRISDLRKTSLKTKRTCIVHNGIIPIQPTGDWSDTMEYVRTKLHTHYKIDKNFMSDVIMKELIKSEIKSKMCIMNSNGEFELIGDFITDDGYIYSNHSYVPYEYKPWKSSTKTKKRTITNPSTPTIKKGNKITLFDMMDGIPLNEEEFVVIDGLRVYGDEVDLYLCEDGVYMEDIVHGDAVKVRNEAYNQNGEVLSYKYYIAKSYAF